MTTRSILFLAASAWLAACTGPVLRNGSPPEHGTSGTPVPFMSEEQVRQELTDRGYSEVYDLRPEADGSWTGSAMLSGKQRPVTVAPDGSITSP